MRTSERHRSIVFASPGNTGVQLTGPRKIAQGVSGVMKTNIKQGLINVLRHTDYMVYAST
jgi:hypothetical protein